VKLETIKGPYTIATLPPEHPDGDNIEIFYTQNVPNRTLFYHGINAFRDKEKYARYFDSPIKLPVLDPISPEEFERRWKQLLSLLRPGDLIQLIDTGSFVSRMIARFDQGSWSHAATYIGNGHVVEAIPIGGVVVRPIGVYQSPRYRVGLYRPRPDYTPEDTAKLIAFCLSTVGGRYSYRQAVALALRKLLGLKLVLPQVSPNDAVVMTNFPLIFVV
jgi:hypothetical protein